MSSPSRIQHPLRAEKRGTFNQKIFPRQPQNTIFRTFSLPPDFPPIGNIFSNHWKTPEKIFQSLEKPLQFFHPLETFFPTIGKLPRPPSPSETLAIFHAQGWVGRAVPCPPEQGTPKHGPALRGRTFPARFRPDGIRPSNGIRWRVPASGGEGTRRPTPLRLPPHIPFPAPLAISRKILIFPAYIHHSFPHEHSPFPLVPLARSWCRQRIFVLRGGHPACTAFRFRAV